MINERSAWRAFSRAIGLMNRPTVWAPLLIYMVLKLGLLAAYALSSGGAAAGVWTLFVGGATRTQLGHYPNNLLLLPVVMGRIDIVLDVFVSVVFQAACICVFAQAIRKEKLSVARAFATALSRYLPMVVATMFAVASLFLWFWLQHFLDVLLPARRTYFVAPFFIGGLCLQALFVYALPLTLLDNMQGVAAVKHGIRLAFKKPWRAFVVVALPFALTTPALYFAKQGPSLAHRLSPEIVIAIQVLQELLHWPAMVLLMGGLAALFVQRKQG